MAKKSTRKKPLRESARAWREVFLKALEQSPKISVAARIAGVHRHTVTKARQVDPEFNQACIDAIEYYKASTLVAVQNKAIELAKNGSERMIETLLKRFDRAGYDPTRSGININNNSGGDVPAVESDADKSINFVRVTIVNNHAEAQAFKRQIAASQEAIDEPSGNGQGNSHAGNGNGHAANGNGKNGHKPKA